MYKPCFYPPYNFSTLGYYVIVAFLILIITLPFFITSSGELLKPLPDMVLISFETCTNNALIVSLPVSLVILLA